MEENATTLVILALNIHHDFVFRLTLISRYTYSDALQEAMGVGQTFLKNEPEIVRVEIYSEQAMAASWAKPLVVLTSDDMLVEAQKSLDRPLARQPLLLLWFKKLRAFGRSKLFRPRRSTTPSRERTNSRQ